jgi:hypothetical protein
MWRASFARSIRAKAGDLSRLRQLG